MMNGTSTHFVLSAGYGSGGGSSGSYNRGRNDYQSSDDRGSSGYSRGRNDYQSNNDDRGSGGYSRGRNDNDDYGGGGGGGGYNRGRSDNYNNNGGGGDDNRLETQRDTIFIQNLPRDVTSDQLRDVFSQIGMIKVRYHSFKSLNRFCENLYFSLIE